MLPSLAHYMQPGPGQNPPYFGTPVQTTQYPPMGISPGVTYQAPQPVPLSPPPSNLQMARPSRPWRMYGRIVGLVILLFFFEQFAVSAWILGLEGEAMYGSLCMLIAIPFLMAVLAMRRPRAILLERAVPDSSGQQLHVITTRTGSLQTPMPTRLDRHLMRDDSILDVPASSASWAIFAVTVVCALGLSFMISFGDDALIVIAAILIIPTVLVGFSIPVMGWWSHSTKRIGLPTRRRNAEAWLIAGMLSTLPAIMINSWFFPNIIQFFSPGISEEALMNLTVVISAPVGEELCKAAAIWFFAANIRSPKHGFQIGFTVGLGFAILENLQYIMLGSFSGTAEFSLTILVRGIGSIPGHGFWTGLTGAAMGWMLMRKRATGLHRAAVSGYQIQAPKVEQKEWALINEQSGQIIESTGNNVQGGISVGPSGVEMWAPAQSIIIHQEQRFKIPLPKHTILGLILAMMGHASWNGTLTIFAIYATNSGMSEITAIVLTICIMILMVVGILIIGSGLLQSVREAPDGSEVDDYQAQLASMGNQKF